MQKSTFTNPLLFNRLTAFREMIIENLRNQIHIEAEALSLELDPSTETITTENLKGLRKCEDCLKVTVEIYEVKPVNKYKKDLKK